MQLSKPHILNKGSLVPRLCSSQAKDLHRLHPKITKKGVAVSHPGYWSGRAWLCGAAVDHYWPSDKVLTMCRKESRSPLISYCPSLPTGGMGLLLMVEPRLCSCGQVQHSYWWHIMMVKISAKDWILCLISLFGKQFAFISFDEFLIPFIIFLMLHISITQWLGAKAKVTTDSPWLSN